MRGIQKYCCFGQSGSCQLTCIMMHISGILVNFRDVPHRNSRPEAGQKGVIEAIARTLRLWRGVLFWLLGRPHTQPPPELPLPGASKWDE